MKRNKIVLGLIAGLLVTACSSSLWFQGIENVKVLGDLNIKGEYKVGGIVGSSSGTSITLKNVFIKTSNNNKYCLLK